MTALDTIFLNDNILSYTGQAGVTRLCRHITDAVIGHFGERVVILSSDERDYRPARHIGTIGWPGRVHDLTATIVAGIVRPNVVFNAYYGAIWTRAAEVYIVYDMIHELLADQMPKHSSYERRFIAEKKACLERASCLIAISASTACDIAKCYPQIDERKIMVAPLGVDESFFQLAAQPIDQPGKPYLLYVGRRSLYKNFLRLLIAYGQSGLASEVDLRVISSEGSGFLPAEQEQIQHYSLQDSVHLLGSVGETALRGQYARSIALVYPSTYEGFGLPILEAMASGTLVATSNVSSMPEVGGEVAFYFDPTSVESIVARLQEVVHLPAAQRSARVAAGIAHARSFSWSRCQRTVIDAFQRLL